MEKRVVITGLGAVTPVGIGKENFYNALLAGQSGIGPITRFDASDYATRIAGEVKDFDITQYGVDKKEARRMDRSVEFAIGAVKKEIMKRCLNNYLLIDSSKFNIRAICTWANSNEFNSVYVNEFETDIELPDNYIVCNNKEI